MVILVSPDARGRITLGRKIAKDEQYAVDVSPDGVITLTPSVVVSRKDFEELAVTRPVLSPEEAFGARGVEDAAEAVYVNRRFRERGGVFTRIATVGELDALFQGGAA